MPSEQDDVVLDKLTDKVFAVWQAAVLQAVEIFKRDPSKVISKLE